MWNLSDKKAILETSTYHGSRIITVIDEEYVWPEEWYGA